MAERVVSVERIDRGFGPYHVTGTVTRVWDPEFAARIKADMLAYLLATVPFNMPPDARADGAAD